MESNRWRVLNLLHIASYILLQRTQVLVVEPKCSKNYFLVFLLAWGLPLMQFHNHVNTWTREFIRQIKIIKSSTSKCPWSSNISICRRLMRGLNLRFISLVTWNIDKIISPLKLGRVQTSGRTIRTQTLKSSPNFSPSQFFPAYRYPFLESKPT